MMSHIGGPFMEVLRLTFKTDVYYDANKYIFYKNRSGQRSYKCDRTTGKNKNRAVLKQKQQLM